MSDLKLALLGPFRAQYQGEPLTRFGSNKVQALLIYLTVERALHPEGVCQKHQREALMELLWPDMMLKSAQNNLRQTIYKLRQLIPTVSTSDGEPEDLVFSERQTVQLNPRACYSLDVATFLEQLQSTRAHAHDALYACTDCQRALEQAAELYRGEFLADFFLADSNSFEEWAWNRRAFLRRQALDALDSLTQVLQGQGQYNQARAYAEKQLAIDNLRESAHRQLMEILAVSGQPNEAMVQYDHLCELMEEELGMAPAAKTTEVYEQIRAGELGVMPPSETAVRGYDLQEEIGAGAIGVVHRARQPQVDRDVAIKIIAPDLANDPEFIRRFEREARLVARLEHPHVVPLYDFWREPDAAYLVMRYLRGGNLAQFIAGGPVPLEDSSRIVDQICSALQVAHQQQIVHRDIKPANILLDDEGNAYLSDFGIAKELGSQRKLTDGGAVVGTPDYVSPEHFTDEPVSPASDMYSLGVVLFQMLTGRLPFPEASLSELMYKHLHERIPSARRLRPELSPMVDEVIWQATAKEPQARFPTVTALAAAFQGAVQSPAAADEGIAAPISPAIEVSNPYKGLQPFQEADSADFYGREALVERLLSRLAPSPAGGRLRGEGGSEGRFLAVVGPSGSGKSSVVQAGLIPALRAGEIAGAEKWFVAEMVPGNHPLEELEAALMHVAVDPPPSLLEPLQKDERGLVRTLKRVLPAGTGDERPQLLLVIDQFEELYTLVGADGARQHFLELLMAALEDGRSQLRLVITLRADFYDRPLQDPVLGELLRRRTEVVLPLTLAELEQAIVRPAARMGVRLEPELATAIAADVVDQPGALPLLQYALTELFERRQNGKMTAAAYEAIGGVRGALGRRAEEIYRNLDAAEREVARQLFLRLVTLGEGVEDTRRRVPRSELEALQGSAGSPSSALLDGVIDAYGRYRLLTFDRDPLTRAPTVEVAHEALLREWPRLRDWLAQYREDVRLQRRLARATAEWQHAGQDEGYLLRDTRLDIFAGWAAETGLALTGEERAYLDASLAARAERQAEEEARRRRELETSQKLAETERKRAEEQTQAAQRLRRRAYVLVGAFVVALILAAAAIVNGYRAAQNAAEAQENLQLAVTREAQALSNLALAETRQAIAEDEAVARREAENEADLERALAERQTRLTRSRELALAALNNLEADPELTMLLALQALETSYTKAAEEALRQGIQASRTIMTLRGHSAEVFGARYSPTGDTVATASNDGTVKVWAAETGRLLHTMSYHGDDFLGESLAYDDAGDRLALVAIGENSESVILNVWEVASGEQLRQKELPIRVENFAIALSDDWEWIVAGRESGAVELWDVASGELLLTFTGHEDTVGSGLAFTDDGSRLAAAGYDGHVRVWDVEASLAAGEGQLIASFNTEPGRVFRIYFNSDGSQLIIGLFLTPREVWDLTGDEPKLVRTGPAGWDMALHPDDQHAAAMGGGRVVLWNFATGEELFTLSGHKAPVYVADFSPDGRRLVTASNDGTARIWNTEPAGRGEIDSFAADPDVEDLKLSPDEETYALGHTFGPATLWDATTGEKVRTFTDGADTNSFRVSFHPDGSRLATASEDGYVRVWDTETGERLLRFRAHTGGRAANLNGTLDVAFSPDGSRLATGGANKLAKVWDAETGEELLTLAGHASGVLRVAYSPDGRMIATSGDSEIASGEGSIATVKVWDADTGEELHSFGPNPNRAWGLAFGPDGKRLAAGGTGGFIILWNVVTGEEVLRFTGELGSVSTLLFTSDGRRLISGEEASARIWELAGGEERVRLTTMGSRHAALSEDESRLYATSYNNSVRIYTVSLEDAIAVARSRLTRSLTEEECRQYLQRESCPGQR